MKEGYVCREGFSLVELIFSGSKSHRLIYLLNKYGANIYRVNVYNVSSTGFWEQREGPRKTGQ